MKLTACLILRDEGKTIYRCLESCLGFVDEFIVGIDKQTADNTRAEVERFWADHKPSGQVYEYEWANDFSKARNMGMDKATGDYILIMDGHEYFPGDWFNITIEQRINTKAILPLVKAEIDKNRPDDVFFHLYQQPFIGETPNNFFMQPRIYRNAPTIRFGRSAHNTIMGTDGSKSMHAAEVIIIHDAPDDNRKWRSEQRIEMNTKVLKEDIEKRPDDIRAMFYLGNTRMEAKDWDGAIASFDNYLAKCKGLHSERYQVLLHKGLCLKAKGETTLAISCLGECLAMDPSRREGYQALSDIYSEAKDNERAIFFLDRMLRLPKKDSRMFQSGASATFEPHIKLANLYKQTGERELAMAHLKSAINYVPAKNLVDMLYEWQGSGANVLIVDAIGSFTKEIAEHFKANGLNVMVARSYDPRLCKWADIIWQEWADTNAQHTTKNHAEKVIMRVHGYEAYAPHLLDAINWNIRQVVCVAEHIKEMIKHRVPSEIKVIPNGVDVDKFYIREKERDWKNIGYAGYLNVKKNPMLLFKVIKENPQFTFHLRADFQDPMFKTIWERDYANCKNVVWHGRYENLSDFWNQMSGVISTSIVESFSFNVAEAMACGCIPYVYDWHGARKTWGNDYIFRDMPKFKKKIDPAERDMARSIVVEKYPLSKMLSDCLSLIKAANNG